MSYYGGVTLREALFTPGQVTRAQNFMTQYRTSVLLGGPAAAVAAVSPSAGTYPGPTTLTATGSNLPTTGSIQIFVPGQPPSQVASAPTPTSITANFTIPLPPGLHCVGVKRNSETVAFLPAGLHVRPSARGTILPAPFAAVLSFSSTVPLAPMAFGIGSPGPPLSLPGAVYTLQLSLFNVLGPFPFVTDAAGDAVFTFPVPPGASGLNVFFQGVELSGPPIRFTNRVRVIFP